MSIGQWMRVLDTVGGLVQMTTRFRRPPDAELEVPPGTGGPLGQLEARLAGVVVAALKEAFDRDRARMDLERSHLDAERQRAEAALRAELGRQAVDRELGQLRLVAVAAIAVWMLSAALGVWLPGMRTGWIPKALMGGGWLLVLLALGSAFGAWRHVTAWAGLDGTIGPAGAGAGAGRSAVPAMDGLRHPAASAALWLLLGAMALTGASLLSAL